MAEKILVTGSNGNVGSQVVKQLSEIGVNVRAGVHSKEKADNINHLDVELFEMDFNNSNTISRALEGIDKVFFLTPLIPDMVEIGDRFVASAKKADIKHIVRMSGMGADNEDAITLGKMHREIEKKIEDSGIPFTHVRPNSFMQNFLMYAQTIKEQNAFYAPIEDGKVSYVNVRDIASVISTVLTNKGHEGKGYTITGPIALSNYEIADILSNVTGRTIKYINVSDNDTRKFMSDMGMHDWLIDLLMELLAIQRAGYVSYVSPDVKEVTGHNAVSFEEFTHEYSSAFK